MGLMVSYLEVGGLRVQLIFNENVIKPGDNKEYIEEATNAIAMLYIKRRCDYKGNILAYFKASLNQTIKIKPTEVIKLLYS